VRSEEEYERVRLTLLQIYIQKIQALQARSVGETITAARMDGQADHEDAEEQVRRPTFRLPERRAGVT